MCETAWPSPGVPGSEVTASSGWCPGRLAPRCLYFLRERSGPAATSAAAPRARGPVGLLARVTGVRGPWPAQGREARLPPQGPQGPRAEVGLRGEPPPARGLFTRTSPTDEGVPALLSPRPPRPGPAEQRHGPTPSVDACRRARFGDVSAFPALACLVEPGSERGSRGPRCRLRSTQHVLPSSLPGKRLKPAFIATVRCSSS